MIWFICVSVGIVITFDIVSMGSPFLESALQITPLWATLTMIAFAVSPSILAKLVVEFKSLIVKSVCYLTILALIITQLISTSFIRTTNVSIAVSESVDGARIKGLIENLALDKERIVTELSACPDAHYRNCKQPLLARISDITSKMEQYTMELNKKQPNALLAYMDTLGSLFGISGNLMNTLMAIVFALILEVMNTLCIFIAIHRCDSYFLSLFKKKEGIISISERKEGIADLDLERIDNVIDEMGKSVVPISGYQQVVDALGDGRITAKEILTMHVRTMKEQFRISQKSAVAIKTFALSLQEKQSELCQT